MTRMRIAIIHSFYSAQTPSGENIVVEAQARALQASGFDVELISLRTDDLASSRLYPLKAALNVVSGRGHSPVDQLRSFAPDVVHVHNLFPNFSTDWLDDWGGPMIATLHNFRPICAAGLLFRDGHTCTLCPDEGTHHAVLNACYRNSRVATLPLALRNRGGARKDRLLSRADHIILLSERAKSMYLSAGLERDKTSVLPNFVSVDGFDPGAPAGDSWVYIGRLTEEKGIIPLLDNWPPSHSLRIFGDGPLQREVQQRTSQSISYEGRAARHEIPDVLRQARGLVFPSLCAEGAPLTYVEALAAGRPVVAFAGNGAADDILQSDTGEVFSEWPQLEAALNKVEADHPAKSQRSLEHYQDAFTVDHWVQNIAKIYRDVVATRTAN